MKQKGIHIQLPELEKAIRTELKKGNIGIDKLAYSIGESKSKVITALYNMYDVYETDEGLLGIIL